MFRLRSTGVSTHNRFRHRGKEIARVEALSDAVCAFSVSLLVASLEVPQTFEELLTIAKGALPFFATVALLFLFWYQQNLFFRRYGINDFIIILLNLCYLAIILFYVYPLKFLFSLLLSSWTGIQLFPKAAEKGLVVLAGNDFPMLIILFSTGYCLTWCLIFGMHQRVLSLAKAVGFNRYELLFTQKERRGALWNALIGLSAIIFAGMHIPGMAGACYLVIPLSLVLNQQLFRHKIRSIK